MVEGPCLLHSGSDTKDRKRLGPNVLEEGTLLPPTKLHPLKVLRIMIP